MQLSSKIRSFSRSAVQEHVSTRVYFRQVASVSMTPTNCSTKVPKERAKKTSSGLISTRHQVDPKKELSRILRDDAAVKGVERKANSQKYNTLRPKTVLDALDEAIKDNQWQSALKIFHLLRKQHWCCCKLGRFDMVKRIVLEMSYLGVGCNTVTYNTIIDGYGKAGMFEEMENVLADMIEDGDSLPDVYTFNSIIGSYGNSGKTRKMESWYERFQVMGVQPNITTFNILIPSFGKARMYKKMSSVIDFMEKRFFSPTTITYNILIETFGKAGRIEKMDDVFRKMKYQGVKPNAITYSSLVNAYNKAGLVVKIDSVLRQIVNTDVVLDTPFFNCIINAYGEAGDLATVKELYIQMEERKCKPDNITFATMIKAYAAHGIFDVVEELKQQMISTDVGKKRLYTKQNKKRQEEAY
ncbi:hypothetical protein AALP_AA5G162300 [Arabis alpina]|uniref:Pentacotripeptide-repeat region of PRORP domain-containing protein n=1 Tax=Arabis alpina TaxID=50452 RepID=A0A087GXG4_ARAAL|nr:hypothetical protein AALP_AA5G162300 [Arabis alpina]